jgi:hypothetical protein
MSLHISGNHTMDPHFGSYSAERCPILTSERALSPRRALQSGWESRKILRGYLDSFMAKKKEIKQTIVLPDGLSSELRDIGAEALRIHESAVYSAH